MKIILLTDVAKIGRKYDIKEVSSGYAQNFLFPKKLAELASDSKVKNAYILKKRGEAEQKIKEALLAKDMSSLQKVKISMSLRANEQGHLFQGIHKDEIAEALREETRIDINADMIELEHPIKSVGDHEIRVSAGDTKVTFKLEVP